MKDKIILLFIIYLSGSVTVQGELFQWLDREISRRDTSGMQVVGYEVVKNDIKQEEDAYVIWHNNRSICMQVQGEDTVTASVTNVLGLNVFNRKLLPYEQACTPALAKGIYIIAFRSESGAFYSKQIIN